MPRLRLILTISALLACIVPPAFANCYDWPLRDQNGEYAYDGDTIYIRLPGLPDEIAKMSVRVRGVDTPEIRGQCPMEKDLANKARDFARHTLKTASKIEFCDPEWDRYGGRVVASVRIDGRAYEHDLIDRGLGRPYDGKTKRLPWCSS
ncbi:thermonuclease family protein [Thalassospira sp.]|uniref:thermonuclease family protein n=1 Tax=Thalassospira sp. TaxID=1912094 RepID=UPI0027366DDC|nr:thermonuclease family protein [Thalassospira sp.]MDP2696861.1 thermonuclease family protein [Thalassospira sp.]